VQVSVTTLLTPDFFDAAAKCVVFGVLPVIGVIILVRNIRQSVRSGSIWTGYRFGNPTLHKRGENPSKFWLAVLIKAVSLFALCAAPILLCIVFFLPRLIAIVRSSASP
jgi:hypothetical protein